MSISSRRVIKLLALAMGSAFAFGVVGAHAQAQRSVAERAEQWTAGGGTVGMRWNRDLAGDIGLVLGAASGRHTQLSINEHELFDLRQGGSLTFDVRNSNLRSFIGGALQARGGYVIDTASGRIDLTDFRLVPRLGNTLILDVVGSDGKAWFYVDRLMYELIDNNQRLAVRTMDLRITPELAARVGHPEVSGWTIGELEMTTDVLRQGANPTTPRGSTKWHGNPVPGAPGALYEADLFMHTFSTQYSRCNGCTGEGGNGSVVFTPSSTLRNNVNNGSAQPSVAGDPLGTSSAMWTADIPWYTKFSGNFPPYANDQHPYLIWNLYRFNADGSIDQIGRSGVKHAFLTTNTSCLENPGDNHILGRGCFDVYSVSNNDSNNSMGPRSEIVPASNQWGRCGSIFDVNCDGVSNSSGNGSYDQRLVVRESQFSGPAQAGATYMFESWYLARQDVNILNSMATSRATFTRTSVWAVGGNDQYKLGPAIDRWVDPAAPGPNASSVRISTAEGNVKVAVKTTDLGAGRWRYDYAVMNLDFARAQTEGAEPNLRVLRNLGFDNFGVPIGSATPTDLVFSDGDVDATNDWTPVIRDGRLTWVSANRNNALNWGTLFRFSFIVAQAPVNSAVTMHIAADNTRETLEAAGVLAPAEVGTPPRGVAASSKAR
ncbi:MAG: hypothetical protein H7Z19_01630 [Chitinophagaceae bacterium]|nr:hypothetical protein [Rubrivivax sp.]